MVARAIDQTNKRVAELETFVGIAKTEEEKKSLRQRIAETEEMTTRIAEALLGKKNTAEPPKEPPKGQVA